MICSSPQFDNQLFLIICIIMGYCISSISISFLRDLYERWQIRRWYKRFEEQNRKEREERQLLNERLNSVRNAFWDKHYKAFGITEDGNDNSNKS